MTMTIAEKLVTGATAGDVRSTGRGAAASTFVAGRIRELARDCEREGVRLFSGVDLDFQFPAYEFHDRTITGSAAALANSMALHVCHDDGTSRRYAIWKYDSELKRHFSIDSAESRFARALEQHGIGINQHLPAELLSQVRQEFESKLKGEGLEAIGWCRSFRGSWSAIVHCPALTAARQASASGF